MDILLPIFIFLFGAAIGSFSNVCIYRLPRKLSIVTPPSQCPSCGKGISPFDNIPIISFLILRGRCRYCQSPISWRYPIVELITGLIFLFLYLNFRISPQFFIYALLIISLIIIAFIDLEHKIIPDVITLPGIIIGLAISIAMPHITLINSIKGLLIGGGLFYAIAILSRGGMGGGDIKLIAMVGSFLGWKNVLLTIFLGSFFGSIVGIVLIILKKKNRKDMVPFGPFLSLGAIVSIFFGRDLIYLWLTITFG
ncbi:MAG TPA: prepilin peptidase [Nitrospinae bacterium]|nr:prepilin peptidase [Nitrospinota bacterium]HBA26695.1 prepilin peptidase [Nitrospinota bacterium]